MIHSWSIEILPSHNSLCIQLAKMADVCVCEILKHIYHSYYIFVLRKEIVIILDNWVMDKVGTCKLYPGINTYWTIGKWIELEHVNCIQGSTHIVGLG